MRSTGARIVGLAAARLNVKTSWPCANHPRKIALMIHKTFRTPILFGVLLAILSGTVVAQETERVYLSGRGKDDAVPWKFMCTTGALSGFWTNIPVPSQWDVLGFGHLTYKKDYDNALTERGLYEKDFAAPSEWKDKRVFLVFEGAMTDTSAKLNGQSVGPTHQGGFYRFKYEVTDKLKFGAENKLEVTVAKHSANESVNKAERLADYWVFGGIYRPVYLEVVPQQFIERVAIDARADGSFAMEVFLNAVKDADSVEAQIVTLEGNPVGQTFLSAGAGDFPVARSGDTGLESPVNRQAGKPALQLKTRIASPKLWTAETPNLYRVEVRLKRGAEVLHTFTERFGFRTFEVRDGDGLYLNGQKIILKGVNRHSFWPDSGRCLSEAVHRLDIETIKEMNGNAVRMSHYPPDKEFLDLCDELGLYVLNELAGWHNQYDTDIGTKLVEAMVTRDVNHPSIIFWNNGNEGGSNPELDKVFYQFDPQQRRVLHPWGQHNGINTAHYLAYTNAEVAARGEPMHWHMKYDKEFVNTNLAPSGWIYMPTEFMHGLYDGGAGAGWRIIGT
jgi:beta-galactosidase/beta-glucuronidase